MSVFQKIKTLLYKEQCRQKRQKLDEAARREEAKNKLSVIEFLVHKVLKEFHGIDGMSVDRLKVTRFGGVVSILSADIVECEIEGDYQFCVEFRQSNGITTSINLDDVTVSKVEDMVADLMKRYFKLEDLESKDECD